MNRKQYIELYHVLQQLSNKAASSKFSYSVSKNIKCIQSLMDEYYAESKPVEMFVNYDSEREKICKQYAEKKGSEFVIENNKYKIAKKSSKDFDAAMDKLKLKYPDLEQATANHQKQLEAWLEVEREPMLLHKVTLHECPDMTPQMMGVLDMIINEESIIQKPRRPMPALSQVK